LPAPHHPANLPLVRARLRAGGATFRSMNLVTVMNYDFADERQLVMCKMWMDSVQRCNPQAAITVLVLQPLPVGLQRYFGRFGNVRVVKGSYDPETRVLRTRHATHNIFFKLFQLAQLSEPFIFLDADIAVLESLEYLWERRQAKPWIGIDHQRNIPGNTGDVPFLNAGVQIVGDPEFYDYGRILACGRACDFRFDVPGSDQGCLWTYFRSIAYDYTHSEIGTEWNACAGFVDLTRDQGGRWRGRVRGLESVHDVYVNHYWHAFKPWRIGCPLYAEARAGLAEVHAG
jgi:hypothetical protein